MYSLLFFLLWLIQLEICKTEISASWNSVILMDCIYIIFLCVHFWLPDVVISQQPKYAARKTGIMCLLLTNLHLFFDVHILKHNVMYKIIFLTTLDIAYSYHCWLIMHYIRQGYKIKKMKLYIYFGFIIGCTAVIVGDCLLHDCLWDI